MFWLRNKKLIIFWLLKGAEWLSGRVLDLRPRGLGLSLTNINVLCLWARHIYPCLVLVQPRKTCRDITEKLLTGTERIKSNKQINALLTKGLADFIVWSAVAQLIEHQTGDQRVTHKIFLRKSVNIFLLIIFSICFGCSKEPSLWDSSFEYPQHIFWLRNKKKFWYVLLTKGLITSWRLTARGVTVLSHWASA